MFYRAVGRIDSRTLRSRHELDISSLCVLGMSYATVPVAEAFSQDLEVVAVHVHWVVTWVMIFHNDAYTCVAAEIVHIPFLKKFSACCVVRWANHARWWEGKTDWVIRKRRISLACE